MESAAAALASAIVLDIDPDLGREIDPAQMEFARRAILGQLLHVPAGPWEIPADLRHADDLVALLIADGLLAREVSLHDRWMVELLGQADALQPPVAAALPGLGIETQLTAVTDLAVVILSQPFIKAAARWPTLLTTLQRRFEAQRGTLAIQGLITQLPNAADRLLLMLWHLSDRWGYVTPEGIVLPWPLNHELLGRLIGARRPTVTIAVRRLEATAGVRRCDDGAWLLSPSAEAAVNAISCAPDAAQSVGQRLMAYR